MNWFWSFYDWLFYPQYTQYFVYYSKKQAKYRIRRDLWDLASTKTEWAKRAAEELTFRYNFDFKEKPIEVIKEKRKKLSKSDP